MNELQHYADRLDALVRQLEPAQIRKLTRELARTIRRSVKQRIAANQAPDGSAYTPRSGLQGRPLRKGEILRQDQPFIVRKLHRYRFLKARHTDRAALVGFMGGLIADIAAQHQEGIPRRPSRLKSGLPARPLLGFSAQDLRTIEALLISHLADAGK